MSTVKATRGRQGNDQGSERRDQLLVIATRLFASRGYTTTTVRDIADEAGILSGSLYHHFDSKEAIFKEVLQNFMNDLLERFEAIAHEEGGPGQVLDDLVRHAFRTIADSPAAVALYQNEVSFLGNLDGFEFVAEGSARIERIWIGAIKAGQESGEFRDNIDVAVVYRFIRDAVWSSVQWYRPGGRHTPETMSSQYLDLLHVGLLKG